MNERAPCDNQMAGCGRTEPLCLRRIRGTGAAPHSDLALLSQQVELALLSQRIQFALLPQQIQFALLFQ
ncbi:hypothetical protein BH160DRAFT_6933 [Burkholderia sp. H160]|nr:hypothetical protein BH160DRAFT_6933 [Burkholderia sp. H160]